jgi:hypothetical protein
MLADIERIHGCLIIDGVCTSGEDATRQGDQHEEGDRLPEEELCHLFQLLS